MNRFKVIILLGLLFTLNSNAVEVKEFKDNDQLHKYLQQQFNKIFEKLPILHSLEMHGVTTTLSNMKSFCEASFGEGFNIRNWSKTGELSTKTDQYYYVLGVIEESRGDTVILNTGVEITLSDFNKIVARKMTTISGKKSELVLIKMHIKQPKDIPLGIAVNPQVLNGFECAKYGVLERRFKAKD